MNSSSSSAPSPLPPLSIPTLLKMAFDNESDLEAGILMSCLTYEESERSEPPPAKLPQSQEPRCCAFTITPRAGLLALVIYYIAAALAFYYVDHQTIDILLLMWILMIPVRSFPVFFYPRTRPLS
jgi:hypothetical protein